MKLGNKVDHKNPAARLCFIFVYAAVMALALSINPAAWAEEPVMVRGVTEPVKDVTLSLDTAGMISAIYFKEGDLVTKGQVILELDKKVDVLEIQRRKLVWESKVELDANSLQINLLKNLLASTRSLYESSKSVSLEELNKLELEYNLTRAENARLEVSEKREKIEYLMAKEALRQRTLVSPLTGVIIKLFLSQGENSEVRQALVHMVDTSRVLFIGNIEENKGRNLRVGLKVDLKINTGSGEVMKKGKVIFVSPVKDPASGLLEIKVEFDNSKNRIRPGSSGWLLID